jgi:hypothetical protein
MTTTSEQLTQINTAITKIEGGAQEYRIGNRSIKRGDLSVLYAQRAELQRKALEEDNSGPAGITYLAEFC